MRALAGQLKIHPRLYAVMLSCLLLSACGFHLRGAYVLPEVMQTTFVDAADDSSQLVRSLKRTLRANDIQLMDSAEQARAVLKLSGEKRSKRVISVDSRGRAREYALSYEISFEAAARDSDWKMERQTIRLQRDFLFDTEDVLGKGREEATLVDDMQQDTVRLIMLRLQAAAL